METEQELININNTEENDSKTTCVFLLLEDGSLLCTAAKLSSSKVKFGASVKFGSKGTIGDYVK